MFGQKIIRMLISHVREAMWHWMLIHVSCLNLILAILKNVTVGYSLPRTWLKALHMERVRVYFSGENLFTFSPLHSNYIDPEHAGASTSWKSGHTNVTSYPMSKTYSFGIDVTF